MASNSRAGGYLTYGAYFNRDPGHYKLRIRMSTTGTANVEAWNSSDNTLMSRRTVPETNGIVSVTMPVDNTGLHPTPVQRGTFLFKQDPVAAIPGQVIEARVYLPAGEYGVVYSVQLIEDKR